MLLDVDSQVGLLDHRFFFYWSLFIFSGFTLFIFVLFDRLFFNTGFLCLAMAVLELTI